MSDHAMIYVKSKGGLASVAERLRPFLPSPLLASKYGGWDFMVGDTLCMLHEPPENPDWQLPSAAGYDAEILLDEPGGPDSVARMLAAGRFLFDGLAKARVGDLLLIGTGEEILAESHAAKASAA